MNSFDLIAGSSYKIKFIGDSFSGINFQQLVVHNKL